MQLGNRLLHTDTYNNMPQIVRCNHVIRFRVRVSFFRSLSLLFCQFFWLVFGLVLLRWANISLAHLSGRIRCYLVLYPPNTYRSIKLFIAMFPEYSSLVQIWVLEEDRYTVISTLKQNYDQKHKYHHLTTTLRLTLKMKTSVANNSLSEDYTVPSP